MADMSLDKNKLDALQKLVQSDPKTIEKMLGQITPDQVNAALNIFNSLDPKTQSTLAGLVTGLKPNGGGEKGNK